MLTMRTFVINGVDLSTTGVKFVAPPIGTVPGRLQEAPTYVVCGLGIVATAAINNAVIAIEEVRSDGTVVNRGSLTVSVTSANVGKPIVITPSAPIQCYLGSAFRLNVTTAGGSGAAAHIAVHYVTSEEILPRQRVEFEVKNV